MAYRKVLNMNGQKRIIIKNTNLTKQVAGYVVESLYEKIPAEVIHAAKRCLIDWLGVALGGSSHPGVDSLLQVAERVGCRNQATIIGRKRKTDTLHAAMISGYMSHVLDYDDTNLESFVHPSAPVWPAILALSSIVNVSGKEALLGFIMGYEVESQIGRVLF
jgi:2-methylcitrate dehydratase PrpD